jgi:hypothetical protein
VTSAGSPTGAVVTKDVGSQTLPAGSGLVAPGTARSVDAAVVPAGRRPPDGRPSRSRSGAPGVGSFDELDRSFDDGLELAHEHQAAVTVHGELVTLR